MTISIRNVDKKLFKRFKLEAKKRDLNIGEAMNRAMKEWMLEKKTGGLSSITSVRLGAGTERLSQEIDEILYS